MTTPAQVAAALAARHEHLHPRNVYGGEGCFCAEPEIVAEYEAVFRPLWRVAKAARAVSEGGWDSVDDEDLAWDELRAALAALDANVEETP